MAGDATSKVRADIEHGQGFTRVVFRRRDWWKRLPVLLGFTTVWLGGALFALLLVASESSPSLFATAWLAIWLVGGLIVVSAMLWHALSVETLKARPDSLAVGSRLLFFGGKVEVPGADIVSIEWIADDPARLVRVNGHRIPQPAIAVAATGRTMRLASGISEGEARQAIASIAQRIAVARRRR